ncbi:phosphoenolpyruvate synthase [Thermolongibacillus altinsuensis]|jgi:DNA/RNA-binding domain of Phe-tRNA-synthetase-like protein|uniref:Phosphoenolpyruvate synthase n=1 Tax=Thermolongibacillus altinsuensis TaxID=575256 RepID=A0A4R1QQH5_9BACL|nr:phenylalanine--tRNA ligase beta subunit-related protein [Thermolongibacillus altinsuensis]TCL51195.1 phosphoenolpyruvate synthase [Thermolongibacillus altinsuensis]GMB08738.1 hypothetical protein B1no1_14480 [Thermolongibacillus altinsuensis]
MLTLSNELKEKIPTFKVGVITYKDIIVGPSPKMLKGKLHQFQELTYFDLQETSVTELEEIKEWRSVFKQVGTDPNRYRPSSESLLRRVQKQSFIPSIHSAADVNNFFSLYYKLPIGIYDLDRVSGNISLTIGSSSDEYIGINERTMNFENKLVTKDELGAFGSPIVDSKRTMVTTETKNAIQVVYLCPSMDRNQSEQIVDAIQKMFIQIHGGTANAEVIE